MKKDKRGKHVAEKEPSKLWFWLFIPLAVFYMEMVVAWHCFHKFMGWGVLYTFLFSVVFGLGIVLVSSLFKRRAGHIVTLILLLIVTLVMGTQAVYFTIFKTFTTLSQADMAGDVINNFWREALNGIWATRWTLLLLFIPFILVAIFGKRFHPEKRVSIKGAIALILAMVVFQLGGTQLALANTEGVMSYRYVYTGELSPLLSVPRFGVLTTLRFEIRNMIFGEPSGRNSAQTENPADAPEEEPAGTEDTETEPVEDTPAVIEYGDNVLEIDFDALMAEETDSTILDMHEYFKNVEPTKQNEYTGMFEGYNLIWMVAEGFSRYAVDEKYTPTLYKMSNEGFVFDNFYNPIWYVSTSDGEYTTMTGLIPKSGVRSYSTSADIYMPYGFGNILSPLGYTCRAYHNHTYEYYGRDRSHPNMGYDYKALGHGLQVKQTWPESDVEMMEVTIPEYINDDLFHTYYMTVSGHLEYNFGGNAMAAKHRDDVQPMLDAGYSEAAAAYIACNMEFDQSVQYLIDELEKAGKLDNTLIVISGDHYPYGLEPSQMEELLGEEFDEDFEMYRTTLIVWNSQMETTHIDKYCSSLDVMPTILNLMGVDYDSRLIMGQDILSDSPALVEFNNKSYITELGRYNSRTDEFIPNEGVTVPEGYAAQMLDRVADEFYYSAKILENDYYAKVFKHEE
jgi:phosphoglycerol transferase MdoB-like AlkP superfamily enzyme